MSYKRRPWQSLRVTEIILECRSTLGVTGDGNGGGKVGDSGFFWLQKVREPRPQPEHPDVGYRIFMKVFTCGKEKTPMLNFIFSADYTVVHPQRIGSQAQEFFVRKGK